MDLETFQALLKTPWAIVLVILFFGASIFVHELGHFLAARWRGLKVERFSIGFGPRLWTRTVNGVEYCISALPLGGYVALPQLADMRGVEGDSEDSAETLPPLSYADKMIVSSAGAVFNVLFALLLGSLLWIVGDWTDYSRQTTDIGYVAETVTTEDGDDIPSPAHVAGLQAGDEILAVDGTPVRDWFHLTYSIIAGTRRADDGRPMSSFEVRRNDKVLEFTLYPVLSGPDGLRRVGIMAKNLLVIDNVHPESPAAQAGLQTGDEIVAIDGEPVYTHYEYFQHLRSNPDRPSELLVQRNDRTLTVQVQPKRVVVDTEGNEEPLLGIQWRTRNWLEHINPFERVKRDLQTTWTVLSALVSPSSDIGLNALSGPVGIGYALYRSAMLDIRFVLSLTVLINVNLAILNLLPIPVLDGGHMAFATIAKLRRRPLPARFVSATQGLFMLLLFSLIIYVSIFDVSRVHRHGTEEREYQEEQARAVEPDFTQARPVGEKEQ